MNKTNPTDITTNSPCACQEGGIARRQFLVRLSVGLSAALGAVVGLPIVGFIVAPLVKKTKQAWRDVGTVDKFPVGTITKVDYKNPSPLKWAGPTAMAAAYVHRVSEKEFVAYSVNCTHLGCPVRWLPDARLFMCPCHGGVYYADGEVAAGPPPLPLPRYPIRVEADKVQIRTSPIPLTRLTS